MGWETLLGIGASLLGGGGNETKQEIDPWVKDNVDTWEGYYANSPVPQYDLDNLTAGLNPYVMENMTAAANYANGAGADQVAMMNAAGLGQMGVAEAMANIGEQGALGSQGWLMNEMLANMSDAKKGGGGSSMMSYGGGGGGGYGGGGGTTLGGDLKFKYDQGTFDQSYNNLIGSANGAFDAWSNKTKTNNLFQNAGGLKIGSQLLGGANTKVGQGAALLDAMTNQQIVDYGAEMQRWASGTADANAMSAGQGNQQTAMGKYQTDVNAATSRANAAMSAAASRANAQLAADTNKYMALVGAASGMYGDSRGYMSDAGSLYGGAGDTFGNANSTSLANQQLSMGAADYFQQYDQAALDRWNTANVFNQQQPGDMALAGLNAMNGAYGGGTTTNELGLINQIGQGITLGEQIGQIEWPTF
jgi:hypothetical protein